MAIFAQPIDPEEAAPLPLVEEERWRRWLGVFVMLSGGIITTLALTCIGPGQPAIADHFKGHATIFGDDPILNAQLVLSMATLGMAAAGLFAGWIIARAGVRRTLFAAYGLAFLAGSCQLWVDSLPVLYTARFVLGCSVVSADVALTTILGARYAGSSRTWLIGFRQAIASAGTVSTFLLSGFLIQNYGWRAPAWMFVLPLLFALLSVAAFNRPLERADRKPEARALERFSALDLWPIYVLCLVMAIAHTMPSSQMPFLLKEDGVTDANLISRVSALSAFIGIITAVCFGFIYRRAGRLTFVLASFCMGAGFIGVGFAPGYNFILACIVVEGIGAGMTQPYFASRILDRITAAQRGQALGFMLSTVFIGLFMNPFVIKPLRDQLGIHMAFVVVGGFLVAAALALGLRAATTRGKNTIV